MKMQIIIFPFIVTVKVKKLSKRTPNLYIYIELDVKKHGETEGRMCKLRELPVYLNLKANECGDILRYRFVEYFEQ